MDPHNVESDLQSLRRLYGLLHSVANNDLLDENTQVLVKRLLDSATKEILDHQNKTIAQVSKLPSLSSRVGTINNLSGKNNVGLKKDVAESMEHVDIQLSAFRYHRTSLSKKALSENGQMFQDSMTCVSSNSPLPVAQAPYGVTKATFGSRDVNVFPLDQSQASCSYVEQGPLLLPLRSVGLKKPSLSKSLEKMSIKPALDQESEFSDEDSIEYESGSTQSSSRTRSFRRSYSRTRSYRTSSVESGSYSDSSRDSNEESDTGSYSSYSQHSHDYAGDGGSEESDSPPRRRRLDKSKSLVKQGKKAGKKAVGGLKRLTTKLGEVFHHDHHHKPPSNQHGDHHDHHHKPSSTWKEIQKILPQKHKGKKPESRALTTTHKRKEGKRKEGGQLKALVHGMMKHRKQSKKPKMSKMLQERHGNKAHWWLNAKGKGSLKLRNKMRAKFGKRNLLRVKDKELEEKECLK
ncbi:unnamed protein product [Cochlearia groenlandica]